MTFPDERWTYSVETEVIRILQTAYSIRNQFYIKSGFFVLPRVIANDSKTIYFPSLQYPPNFWDIVKQNSVVLSDTNHPIIQKLREIVSVSHAYSDLQSSWNKVNRDFWHTSSQMLPEIFEGIHSLEIRPTQYGSIATGYSNWMKNDGNIVVYVRMDADSSHIAEAIMLDRFRRFDETKQYTWEEREAIIDFLLTESKLKTLFTNFSPTLEAIRQKQNAHLAKESKEYLQSYGFTFEQIFDIKDGNIYMQGKLISLTEYESLALKLLIEKRRTSVSYDELADAIWGVDADEKFSIAAITKLIERLRKTIESNGVFPTIIQTCKGYGYMLVD